MPATLPGKLVRYRGKRRFRKTPEPAGRKRGEGARAGQTKQKIFVVQKHDARRLHYDFRLEAGGVLKSWAVPKGPSTDPTEKRLAVRTEDHPLEYAGFEGLIPEGEYGSGPVIIWDKGTYENLTEKNGKLIPVEEAVLKGHIKFLLKGKKLRGVFALTRIRKKDRENWILVKTAGDEEEKNISGGNPVESEPLSVLTGRAIEDVVPGAETRAWTRRGEKKIAPSPELLQAQKKLRKAPQPRWINPMLATLSERPFFAPGWVYEPKLDGERCIAFRSGGREVRLMSRNRKELNGNYPELVEALRREPSGDFIVDGEVVALENGRPSFSKLQPRMQTRDPDKAMRSGVPVYYYLFDLLYYEGHSLMALPLSLRKEVLKNTFSFQDPIRYTSHVEAEEAEKYLAGLCAGGWEGVIAKKADGPYLEKRSRDWLKFKCGKEQEFIILGYTDPSGARTGFGALLIGYYKDGKLLYAGKVGTGYDEHTLKTLGATLEEMRIEGSPPALQPHKEIPHRGVHWVEPSLIAQVAFSEWTPDGLLRHPRFKGLRRDKFPREVGLEKPGA